MWRLASEENIKLTPMPVARVLKCPNEIGASTEGAALTDGVVEIHGDQITDSDIGRVPPASFDTTVQPVEGSVGSGGRIDLFWKRVEN